MKCNLKSVILKENACHESNAGHVDFSSDRPANKILRKVRKKLASIRLKNLETNAVLTTVLEKSWPNPEKAPPKMWNTIGKVIFSKKMLPMKTILWSRRVQFW